MNVFLFDNPVTRTRYLVITLIIFALQALDAFLLSPFLQGLLFNHNTLYTIIQILLGAFFAYIAWVNDSKRLWHITDKKWVAIILALLLSIVNNLNIIMMTRWKFQLVILIGILCFMAYICLLVIPGKISEKS